MSIIHSMPLMLCITAISVMAQNSATTADPTNSTENKAKVTLLDANDSSSVGTVLLNAGAHSGASYESNSEEIVSTTVSYGPEGKTCGGYCAAPPDCAGPGLEACPFCVNNRCGPDAPRTCASPCEKPADCAGPGLEACPMCIDGKCQKGPAGCADACETADDCSGDPKCQFCVDHKCVADVCAAACESNNDCAGSPCPVCTNGKCEAPAAMHPIVPIYVPVGMMTPIYPNNPYHVNPPQPLLKSAGKWPNIFGDGTGGVWKQRSVEGYALGKGKKPKSD